jgi:host factor-I protein
MRPRRSVEHESPVAQASPSIQDAAPKMRTALSPSTLAVPVARDKASAAVHAQTSARSAFGFLKPTPIFSALSRPKSVDRTLQSSSGVVVKHQETRSKRPGRKLQQQQLAIHRASRLPVVIHLSNGTRLRGIVVGADEYMVLLAAHAGDPNPQLIYKHAISAMTQVAADVPLPVDEMPDSPDFVPIFVPRTRTRRKREPARQQKGPAIEVPTTVAGTQPEVEPPAVLLALRGTAAV